MASYSKKIVPLDVVLNRKPVLDTGVALPDVTVLRLSLAAENDVFLHFGESGDPVDLSQGYAFHITPPELTGLYVTVTVPHPGESLRLLLGYTSGSPSRE